MTLRQVDPRPFAGESRALLVLPILPSEHPEHETLHAFRELILRELPELEAEVGCPVAPVDPDRVPADLPAILVGPAAWSEELGRWRSPQPRTSPSEPYVAIDREQRRVVIDAPDLDGAGDAFQLLRSAIADRVDVFTLTLCASASEVIDRIDAEVRRTFPMLAQRVPEWPLAVERAHLAISGPDDFARLQCLMVTLADAHSWVKDTRINGRLPYHLHDDGITARFWSVPETSAAWELGVRAGDIALAPNTAPWRERAGSVSRARPWNIGYRAVQGRVGESIELAAVRQDGSTARWSEPVPPLPWDAPIDAGRLDDRTGYLRIRGWLNTAAWRDALTGALTGMTRYERLVVDLRGNVGGALVAAQDARSRFLPARTLLGTIRFSTVTGELGRPHGVFGEPPEDGPRWTKPVRFVTDPLCYSATEDFLHGLQGLPHVQLVGQATGGGSGRPRTIRLRPHLVATVSTALTYDRAGRCIEGNGLAPDVAIDVDPKRPDVVMDRILDDW